MKSLRDTIEESRARASQSLSDILILYLALRVEMPEMPSFEEKEGERMKTHIVCMYIYIYTLYSRIKNLSRTTGYSFRLLRVTSVTLLSALVSDRIMDILAPFRD